MEVIINQQEAKALVTVKGRIDTSNAEQFQQDLTPLMENGRIDIDIDCADLEYTSSQGLRSFLLLQKNVNAKGGKLVLRNMRPMVKEVFDITGFSNIITIL